MGPHPSTDLSGHVAVVTGANQGIGAATAQALAARGVAVLVTYLRLQPDDDEGTPAAYGEQRLRTGSDVVASIRSAGGRAMSLEADLANTSSPAAIFEETEARFGPADILINNASGWVADTFGAAKLDRLGRGLQRVSAETIDRVFAVDARGGALMISEFARRHAEHGLSWGRIVSLTSGRPLGFPEEVSYGAAKAALENFTMSAASELAGRGVTANVVHPPVTDTGWVGEDARVGFETAGIRIATPLEVAEVIAYLVSNAAQHVNGNIVRLR